VKEKLKIMKGALLMRKCSSVKPRA